MTVGQELEKISNLRLFHNHVPIELVRPYFSYSSKDGRQLVHELRMAFFNAFAASSQDGYIITFVWQFDADGEREYMEGVAKIFEERGAEIFWVELEASLEERLERNRSENRLRHKPSKRDTAFSEQNLLEGHETHRLNSNPGELPYENYLRVDNSKIPPGTLAQQILKWIT